MDWKKLSAPFSALDIEWRVDRSGVKDGRAWGVVLAYITNRAIQDRLDEVVGPANWKNEYKEGPSGGVLCGLSIRVDGEWVTKWDGAENSDFESVKGGLSGSMKRAGVQWGLGRYLYKLPETFVWHTPDGINKDFVKDKKNKEAPGVELRWNPPALPAWALPSGEAPAAGKKPAEATGASAPGDPADGVKTLSDDELKTRLHNFGLDLGGDQKKAVWARIKGRAVMEQEKLLWALQRFGAPIVADLLVTKTDKAVDLLVTKWEKKVAAA
jgi:hypothetical protein